MLTEALIRFRDDEDGAVAVIVALVMLVLVGFVALGVDVASLYRDRARLQVASDMTAMSAMGNTDAATERAESAARNNDRAAETITELQLGRYLRNPALAPEERFTPLDAGAPGINAVQVVLRDTSPLHFAQIFSDETEVSMTRTAMATRTGAASFSLGSAVAQLDGAALNRLLEQEFGASAQIALGPMQALANTQVSLGDILDGLGGEFANPAEVLNAVFAMNDVVGALRAQVPPTLAPSLAGLEGAVSGQTVDVAALVGGIETQLGLTATGFLGDIRLSALDVIGAMVGARGFGPVDLETAADVAGVLALETRLVAGEPPAQSGWIALGEEGVQLHRAATRLSLGLEADAGLLRGLGGGVTATGLQLPLYVELAGATAMLDEISCTGGGPSDLAASFLVSSTPLHPANGTSVAALYLGQLPWDVGPGDLVNPADLEFADLLTVEIVVDLPLLPDLRVADLVIQARSHVAVGASGVDRIDFTRGDVAAGDRVRRFGSEELLSTAVADLLSPENTEFRIQPGQEGLVSGLVAPVVNGLLDALPDALLAALAAPVDAVLDGALSELGVTLGAGELTLTGHHCELVRLVQ